jgi:hypothetical protein
MVSAMARVLPIDRALRAEAMLWDYERDFMPPGLEVVERHDLLMIPDRPGPRHPRIGASRT